jgi:hypothetical protein
MAPIGSGSFGVSLDPQVIEANARANFGLQGVLETISEIDDQCNTPMQEGDSVAHGNLTPTVCMTPNLAGLATPASFYPMTPHGALFSPRHDGQIGFDSPAYQSPSPAYGNPTSPGYITGYQFNSPVYNQGGLKQSPNYQKQQSPAYLASG